MRTRLIFDSRKIRGTRLIRLYIFVAWKLEAMNRLKCIRTVFGSTACTYGLILSISVLVCRRRLVLESVYKVIFCSNKSYSSLVAMYNYSLAIIVK